MDALFETASRSLLRKPMIYTLVDGKTQIRIPYIHVRRMILQKEEVSDVFFVQAYLWPKVNEKLPDASLILIGNPSWFYSWFEATSIQASAFITPYDHLQNTIPVALKNLSQNKHYLSAFIKNLLECTTKQRQERLLNISLASYLTKSELEVLVLISQGYTTSEIADLQVRSIHTVKTKRKNIREKLRMSYGQRLGVFAGRKLYALKTLYLIEMNRKKLDNVFENTP